MVEKHMTGLSGPELHRFWLIGKKNGLTQRKLASMLGEGFNSVHGKIFREQQKMTFEENTLQKRIPDPIGLKAAVFDIETMAFVTGGLRNHIVCTSILSLEGEMQTLSLNFDDASDDRRVLTETVEALSEFDILIGHNVAAFDFNWLHSRLMYHRLPSPSKRWLYYDTYQASRRMAVKADRKSLAMLCDFFRVPAVKTAVMPVSWSAIDSRNESEFDEAMADIIYHCEQDVLANRYLFDVLWPRDRGALNMPFTKKW